MKSLFFIVGLFASLLSQAVSECPDIEYLAAAESSKFVCAYSWAELGDADSIQGCNDVGNCASFGTDFQRLPEVVYDGDQGDGMDGSSRRMTSVGSLAVMPGCTFYEFSSYDYMGTVREHGMGVEPLFDGHFDSSSDSCGEYFYSYKCRCSQTMIDCQPSDQFYMILSCDNTMGSQPVQCHYEETQGTSYGVEETETRSRSHAVDMAMQIELLKIFSYSLGYSFSTSYDWSETISSTFDEAKSFSLSAVAAPGELVQIEQAVGQCGDNESFTNFFRIRNRFGNNDETANVTHYRRDMGNGHYQPVDVSGTDAPIFVNVH